MGTDNLEEFLRNFSSWIVIASYIYYCCYCHKQPPGVFCEKVRSEISQISWESSPDNSALLSGLRHFCGRGISVNNCSYNCCGFVLLFFMLWYNVSLIFHHITCYVSISRDQFSSVFSWSAHAWVMFPFFSFFLVSLRLHYTKFRLVPLSFTTCASHGPDGIPVKVLKIAWMSFIYT